MITLSCLGVVACVGIHAMPWGNQPQRGIQREDPQVTSGFQCVQCVRPPGIKIRDERREEGGRDRSDPGGSRSGRQEVSQH